MKAFSGMKPTSRLLLPDQLDWPDPINRGHNLEVDVFNYQSASSGFGDNSCGDLTDIPAALVPDPKLS